MPTVIFRIVPKDAPTSWDNDYLDMDEPCDLIAVSRELVGDIFTGEVRDTELQREAHPSGHAASKRLCEIVRG